MSWGLLEGLTSFGINREGGGAFVGAVGVGTIAI